MKDIYEGEWWSIWSVDDIVFISLGNITVSFPLEEWEEIKADFMKMKDLE